MNTPRQVRLVSVIRNNETVVGVRDVATDRALCACAGIGHEGAAHALLAMVQWCAARGYEIVSTPLAAETRAA